MDIKNYLLDNFNSLRLHPRIQPEGIVIHYVANPNTTAVQNRNYFNSKHYLSAHYIVDLDGTIIRCLPDKHMAYHAGTDYSHGKLKVSHNNEKYIGIEFCHPTPDGKPTEKTETALIELCVYLCKKYNFTPTTDIHRHYDVAGKLCPKWYVDNKDEWINLKSCISGKVYSQLLYGDDNQPMNDEHIKKYTNERIYKDIKIVNEKDYQKLGIGFAIDSKLIFGSKQENGELLFEADKPLTEGDFLAILQRYDKVLRSHINIY